MRNFIQTVVMIFLGLSYLSAQSRSDFEMRIENSFLKLYENPEVAIHAAKEIRNDRNDLVIKDILSQAFLLKGDYLESVRIGFEKASIKSTNSELLVRLIIAREFYYLNLYEQTAQITEPFLSLEKNNFKPNKLAAQFFQLESQNQMALKNLDGAKKSLSRSSKLAAQNQNSLIIISKENELIRARISLEKGNLAEARKIADQLLQDLQSIPRAKYLLALTQQFRGQLFFEEQEYDQAIECLQNSLQAIEKTTYIPLKSKIYEDLAKNYLVINRDEDFELYKGKFTETAKLLEENKKAARRELIQLSTDLSEENNKLILQKKQEQLFYILGISLLIASVLVYILSREVQKSKSLLKRIRLFRTLNFKQSQPPTEDIKAKEILKKALFIPKETEEEILKGLEEFEESKKYLDNNMSLATLAVTLDTNTKYLSEIINKYKHKNFSTYINELRIKYVIHLLSTDRSYLQYKISYIAEIGGFTSHSAFTNIFKSVTGMSPNEYMQTLRQQT